MPIKPSTRPESYPELLVRSLKLYWQVLPSTFMFALLTATILFIPRLICVWIGQDIFLTTHKANQVFFLYLAIYISTLWFFASVLWCINCLERNKHKNFIVDAEMAAKRILYVMGAALCLFFISALIGLAAYFLHEIFLRLNFYFYNKYLTLSLYFLVLLLQVGFSILIAVLFYFYFPLIVIEHDGVLLALRQSMRLVWKEVGMTLRLQLTPWLVYFIFLIVIKMLFKLNIHIYFMPGTPAATVYPTLLHILIFTFFIPWVGSMILVQLRDLELRKAAALQKNDLTR